MVRCFPSIYLNRLWCHIWYSCIKIHPSVYIFLLSILSSVSYSSLRYLWWLHPICNNLQYLACLYFSNTSPSYYPATVFGHQILQAILQPLNPIHSQSSIVINLASSLLSHSLLIYSPKYDKIFQWILNYLTKKENSSGLPWKALTSPSLNIGNYALVCDFSFILAFDSLYIRIYCTVHFVNLHLKVQHGYLLYFSFCVSLGLHCKKRLSVFPSQGGMSNSPWPEIIWLFPARVSLVSDILAREGKAATLFTV